MQCVSAVCVCAGAGALYVRVCLVYVCVCCVMDVSVYYVVWWMCVHCVCAICLTETNVSAHWVYIITVYVCVLFLSKLWGVGVLCVCALTFAHTYLYYCSSCFL